MYRPPKISERLSAAHAQGHGQPERGVRAGNGVAVVGTRSAVDGNGDGRQFGAFLRFGVV